MSVILALLLAAQTTPVAPIVKGTGLPPPGTDEAQAMAPVNALLAAIAARDAAAVGQALRADATATAVAEKADGTRSITHSTREQLMARFAPGPERYRETLTDIAVDVDGDVAMVWAPYTFSIDGKTHHCGTDHFDLVREGGAWKIQNLTWSSRTTGCDG